MKFSIYVNFYCMEILMFKKLMLASMFHISFVLADNLNLELEQNKQIKSNNSTSVGSKSYNNNYEPLQLNGRDNEKYYTESNFKDRQNSPTKTGTSAYSNKAFPTPSLTGEPGKRYYNDSDIKNGSNQSDQGSKSFSNKAFPVPEIDNN